MKKISIVGVEGSGKTVLMSVLGEKYAMPDKHGLSLKAKEGKTFKFCTSIVAAMRKGEWPMPTMPGEISELEWELFRYKGKSTPKVLGNVNVLDFAGEVYRQAFGINSTVDESNKEDVEKLRRHVSQSDILIVLINLKDIIDGDRTHPRTIEMLWLSQSILDFAKKHRVKDVALVFSQADRYKTLLEQHGGVVSAFKKYLPNVMYAFPNVSAFEVSAVDGTRIDDSTGKVVPACDFATTGLDKLMLWINDRISPRKLIMKMLLFVALVIMTGVLRSAYEKLNLEEMNVLKIKEFIEAYSAPLRQSMSAKDAYEKGVNYYYGRNGFEQNDIEAVKWYRKSAEQGNARAQFNLGLMYKYGLGVEQDYAEAVTWYRKAAEQGHAKAQFNLGSMYEDGQGVEQDYAEAVKWYRKAAEQGDASAQCNLGLMYCDGRGVTKDDSEAVKWYRKSAEQGNAYAQYNLGVIYEYGRGVTQDDYESVKWYRRAAEQGNEKAKKALERLQSLQK